MGYSGRRRDKRKMARDQETKTQKKRAERGKEIGIDKSGGKDSV